MVLLRVSADAVRDLDAIADYIMEDNPRRALSFVDELTGKFRAIAERPLSFPARSDLGSGVRSALHGKYLIVFQLADEFVEILRVVHGARDLGTLF